MALTEEQKQKNYESWQKRKKEAREKYKEYIEGFYKIACRELKNYPKEYQEFLKAWHEEDNFRNAYRIYMEFGFEHEIKLTPEEKKIEQEFYGLFVN